MAKYLESGKIRSRIYQRAEDVQAHVASIVTMRDELQKCRAQLMVALSAIQDFKHTTD